MLEKDKGPVTQPGHAYLYAPMLGCRPMGYIADRHAQPEQQNQHSTESLSNQSIPFFHKLQLQCERSTAAGEKIN